MTTGQALVSDFGVVTRQLDAIERGDMDELRRSFAPGARVWHNNDEIEQDVDHVVAVLTGLCSVSSSRKYEDRRITTVGNVAFIQHTLTAVLLSGREMRMPAMMRVEVSPNGLVDRIEEYFDSRDADVVTPDDLDRGHDR